MSTNGIVCPYCNWPETNVTDSRDHEVGMRRRRVCVNCGQSFSTMEVVITSENKYISQIDIAASLADLGAQLIRHQQKPRMKRDKS